MLKFAVVENKRIGDVYHYWQQNLHLVRTRVYTWSYLSCAGSVLIRRNGRWDKSMTRTYRDQLLRSSWCLYQLPSGLIQWAYTVHLNTSSASGGQLSWSDSDQATVRLYPWAMIRAIFLQVFSPLILIFNKRLHDENSLYLHFFY